MSIPAGHPSVAANVAARFPRDTENHHLVIARDDGLYRHLRFRDSRYCNDGKTRPYSSFYWFDLITWPGHLTITGDMETFSFARTEDMFTFFRGAQINPGYWAEKLLAPRPLDAKVYSEDRVREYVIDDLTSAVKHGRGVPRGTGRAIREQILEADEIGWEPGTVRLLADFEHGVTFTGHCPSCGDHTEGLPEADEYTWRTSHLRKMHRPETRRVDGFRFDGTWEWDLRDWSYQFLWCCHAIQWGIRQYDAIKAATTAPPEGTRLSWLRLPATAGAA